MKKISIFAAALLLSVYALAQTDFRQSQKDFWRDSTGAKPSSDATDTTAAITRTGGITVNGVSAINNQFDVTGQTTISTASNGVNTHFVVKGTGATRMSWSQYPGNYSPTVLVQSDVGDRAIAIGPLHTAQGTTNHPRIAGISTAGNLGLDFFCNVTVNAGTGTNCLALRGTGAGFGTTTPTSLVHVKSTANDSGMRLETLTSATPAATGATGSIATLGVDSTGKVVVQAAPAPAIVGGQVNASNVASYNANAIVTGAVVITTKIPAPSTTMFDIRIEGYDYTATSSWDIQMGGYMYNPLGWYNTGWQGVNRFIGRGVQYGVEGGFVVVILGTTTSVWSYPKINIRGAMVGHSSAQTTLLQGWSIALRTDISAITNLHTPPLINTTPTYATNAAATADATLPANALYRVGNQVFVK